MYSETFHETQQKTAFAGLVAFGMDRFGSLRCPRLTTASASHGLKMKTQTLYILVDLCAEAPQPVDPFPFPNVAVRKALVRHTRLLYLNPAPH
jgi:hypothetical protein